MTLGTTAYSNKLETNIYESNRLGKSKRSSLADLNVSGNSGQRGQENLNCLPTKYLGSHETSGVSQKNCQICQGSGFGNRKDCDQCVCSEQRIVVCECRESTCEICCKSVYRAERTRSYQCLPEVGHEEEYRLVQASPRKEKREYWVTGDDVQDDQDCYHRESKTFNQYFSANSHGHTHGHSHLTPNGRDQDKSPRFGGQSYLDQSNDQKPARREETNKGMTKRKPKRGGEI